MFSIYYDDNSNLFEDEHGNIEYDMSAVMPFDAIMKYKKVGGTYITRSNGEDIEVVFPIKEEHRSLYYCSKDNVIENEEGFIVYNIFSIITPNDLMLFKKGKETVWIKDIDGDNIELVYSDEYYE